MGRGCNQLAQDLSHYDLADGDVRVGIDAIPLGLVNPDAFLALVVHFSFLYIGHWLLFLAFLTFVFLL